MYRNSYDAELRDETRFAKKALLWVIALSFVVSGVAWALSRSVQVADTAILRYEEFQEIHNTCSKINTDLGVIRAVPADDQMFAAFSKAAVIAQKQQQMSRWVEDYNAKSKMWNRSLWKSNSLPYQLDVNQFPHYAGNGR